MKKKVAILLLLIFCLFLEKNASAEPVSIGDFFHGKKAEYKIEFEALFRKYEVLAVVDFYKIGNDGYLIKFSLDKNYVKYIVETYGVIYDNKLYPTYVEEKIKIVGFNYTTKYKYHYDGNYNLKRIRVVNEGSTGFKTKTYLTDFSKNHTTDLLSGVMQLIYWIYYLQNPPPLDIVREDFLLRNLQLKTYQKDGIKHAKLKDKNQEYNFDLENLEVKIGKNGWPTEVIVDEHWILKNIKITLTSLK